MLITNIKNFLFTRIIKPAREPNLNIFLVYILVIIIVDLVFYPLFPLLLNYPPGSINSQFDIEFSRIPYYQQYIIINLLIISLGYFFFRSVFKDVRKWSDIDQSLRLNDVEKIKKIRKKSLIVPHIVFVFQILIPVVLVGCLFIALGFHNHADLKFFIILTISLSLPGEISYLFSKSYFRQVLKNTFTGEAESKINRIGLRSKILLQILPLFLFSILFISFVGQSGIIREKGDALFRSYYRELQMKLSNVTYIENEEQIKSIFRLIKTDFEKDIPFYIDPSGNYQTSDNSELSKFFLKYTKELAFRYQGHTYDYYGSDVQGVVLKIPGKNGDWIFGIKYSIASPENVYLFIASFIGLSLLAIMVILYFGKTMSDDISIIAVGLKEIAEGGSDNLNNKIAVTSCDEIGDLAISFNQVQECQKKYVQDIKDQQNIIVERERLASLGQMISGITHNLKTPIMSLSDAIHSLNDLVTEYQLSIGDQQVDAEDHREIASEMDNWLKEMAPYCSYMSDVLATIKGQIIQGKTSLAPGFTVEDLLKKVEILTNYELIKSDCSINFLLKINPSLELPGEVSNLVQVLDNLISNSIQAYQGKGGIIDLTVNQSDSIVMFTIRDYGMGIPEDLKEKLFKEMVTTKGKMGTGLGLYISYAIVKGKFGGELWCESKQGEGTVFYVTIPLKYRLK